MADSCCLRGISKSQSLCCVFVFLLCIFGSCTQSLDTCIEVKTAYAGKGFDESDVPVKAISGAELALCPQTETCCTKAMEEKLISLSRKEHTAQLDKMLGTLQKAFVSRRRKFDEFFTKLINRAETGLHEMFVETYGLLYQQNSKIFTDLFTQLRYYYTGRDIDLKDVMNSFFNELLQKMFELLNQVRVDDRYRQCLTNTMDELKPFADVPIKLSMHVKRALIAARTFVQGLAVGRDVITTIMEIAPSEACVQGIVRMTHCPYCRGLTATKPCHNFCMNTMKGCLANHAELNAAWNDYINALDMVASRLNGPFNIESVVTPIDVEISEAIMTLQDDGAEFSKKAIAKCGQAPSLHPTRKKREAQRDAGAQRNGKRRKQQHTFDYRKPRDCRDSNSCLDKLVRELEQKIMPYKDFWVKLPYTVCDDEKVVAAAKVKDDCWNGKDRARYVPEVQEDGVLHQLNNPEVKVDINAVNSVITRQKIQLQHITNKLNTAYKGEDVAWVDIEDDIFISGSGSGDGSNNYDDEEDEGYRFETDDEDGYFESDDEDAGILEGSGAGQGRGSGGGYYVPDGGNINIDGYSDRFTPGNRGNGNNRGRYSQGGGRKHRKNYPHFDNSDLGFGDNGRDSPDGTGNFNNNGGQRGSNNVPPIVNPGGRMYNGNDNNNNNNNNNNNYNGNQGSRERNESPSDGGGKLPITANISMILLLLALQFVFVRRFLTPGLSLC